MVSNKPTTHQNGMVLFIKDQVIVAEWRSTGEKPDDLTRPKQLIVNDLCNKHILPPAAKMVAARPLTAPSNDTQDRPQNMTPSLGGEPNMFDKTLGRRDALKLGAATAGIAAIAGPTTLLTAAEQPAWIPISVQLYSVRKHMKGDGYVDTIKKIGAMGFEGVEFAGYGSFGKDPKGLKKVLDDAGVKAAATHIGAFHFKDLNKTIEFHQAIGCKLLIVPGDGAFTHKEKSKQFAEMMNTTAAKLKEHGMWCGYHNHSKEFKEAEGDKTWWDLFAERTDKRVVLQQDVGWTVVAGKDPAKYVRKYPGRTLTTHCKPKLPRGTKGKIPIIGQDVIDWKDLIKAYYEVGGTMWLSVEQEDYPKGMSPLQATEASFKGLHKILAEMGKKKPA
jgi:sugar phosphate isomerase/epimerase